MRPTPRSSSGTKRSSAATASAGLGGKLALLGGQPIAPKLAAALPAWPPADQATARRLSEVYLSRQWSFNGPVELQFAKDFAAFHGAKHGIMMVNGTVTLQCALTACGVKPGDEVIVPALTWMATAMAANYVGAIPVFVDIEPQTLCIDPRQIEAAITRRTRAIIPVHLYGSMADMDAILRIARRHKLAVIEDCAHGHGGKWNGRGVGSWGDVGSFSFQQSKAMAAGEGGICITSSDEVAQKLHRLKHIGYAPAAAQGQAASGPPRGLVCHNFRSTDFTACILAQQLLRFPKLVERYNANADRLTKRLGDLGLRCQARGRKAGPQNYYAFGIFLSDTPLAMVPRETLHKALVAEGLKSAFGGTYGPVVGHMLFNLKPDEYRVQGPCPVANGPWLTHTLMLMHYWLGASASAMDQIAAVFAKLLRNADALKA